MDQSRFHTLLHPDTDREFVFIDPPFNFNAAGVAKYPPEVTGSRLLNSMCRRLGWNSLAGKRLLDFGCGVRLARTIVNLGIEIDRYVGVDANKAPIDWLRAHVADSRFRFEWLDLANTMYNLHGRARARA